MPPRYHVGLMTAIGRRIRRTHLWRRLFQALVPAGRLAMPPAPWPFCRRRCAMRIWPPARQADRALWRCLRVITDRHRTPERPDRHSPRPRSGPGQREGVIP